MHLRDVEPHPSVVGLMVRAVMHVQPLVGHERLVRCVLMANVGWRGMGGGKGCSRNSAAIRRLIKVVKDVGRRLFRVGPIPRATCARAAGCLTALAVAYCWCG